MLDVGYRMFTFCAMSDTQLPAHWRTWLQLVRAPNLFTVPGDPLAGYFLHLATGGRLDHRLPMAVAASLGLYSFGLLLNDLVDIREDKRDRPTRPLPSRAANVYTVLAVAIGLALVALVVCFATSKSTFLVGVTLLAAIILYNSWAKKIAILGPLNMGLCRGLSLLLGATAGILEISSPADVVVVRRNVVAASPAGHRRRTPVKPSTSARHHPPRTHRNPRRSTPAPRTLPFVTLSLVVVAFFLRLHRPRAHPLRLHEYLALSLFSAYTLYAGFKVHNRLTHQPPPPLPPIIGQRFIRLLLPLQAVFLPRLPQPRRRRISAAALFVLWPICKSVSRRFYAS